MDLNKLLFDKTKFSLMAGPCSIESEEHFQTTANYVKEAGAQILRGGIYKLRTSKDSFQGLGLEGYELANKVRKGMAMPFVTEITDPRQTSALSEVTDIFQVGSRNMYNYDLLKELSLGEKPVLLKRGFSATVDEWVKAAEYVEANGSAKVLLCERGIRSFDNTTRNVLDLGSVAYLKQHTHYPVIVDPSHATGRRDLVIPMSLAAVASGADGLIVETHPTPETAMSDGPQSLNPEEFSELTTKLKDILKLFNRELF
ncbi:MAG: 3-deoxy-7-phosphoheptulonate synthase [Bdellovibrionota bacterium]|nr:3-deoxy-7-phosphoheptulonate synthase [Bdellovibrionota bacterium]